LKEGQSGYAHFNTPFILTVQKTLDCIRNLQYSYMVGQDSLFPKVVSRYDSWAIRELLNNCVAHQDYSRSSRIIVEEYNNRLVFRNAGRFIPESVEEVIRHDSPQEYYRNPFLTDAMVNLNMIETIGSGIKKIFTIQRSRFFPMPTYDFSKENSTIVAIYGELIDQNYTNILGANPDLPMDDVIALDKVQKKQPIDDEEINRLRKKGFIEGRKPNFHIPLYVEPISKKDEEVKDDEVKKEIDYKQIILKFIDEHKVATKTDIDKLILDILPPALSKVQKETKVRNLVHSMSKKDISIRNGLFVTWVKN
jgi:ATP-dependent DNA helicase RecG